MGSLFEGVETRYRQQTLTLAAWVRAKTLHEFVGQEHFLGEGRLLWRLLKANG